MNVFVLLTIALPVFLIIYGVVPIRFQKLTIIIGSILYYGFFVRETPVYLVCLLGSLAVNYAVLQLSFTIHDSGYSKVLVMSQVFANAGVLVICKAISFLPPGISFYTFSLIALLLDIEKIDELPSLEDYFVMLICFPKLLMGPITRWKGMRIDLMGLNRKRQLSIAAIENALPTLIAGLGLKYILADQLSTLWGSIQTSGVLGLTLQTAWLGAIVYTMNLYFDFWGYSLIAISLCSMLGLTVPVNFDQPYSSRTVSEFWRRWHITLGAWFRDYVYIPMGGSRSGALLTIRNLLTVWLLTGLWHGFGLTYLIWGLVLGILVILEKFTPLGRLAKSRILGRLYVCLVMPVTWMIFAHDSVAELKTYLLCMIGIYSKDAVPAQGQFLRYLMDYRILLPICLLVCFPVTERYLKKLSSKRWFFVPLLIVLWVVLYVLYIGMNTPFIYSAF